MASLLLINGTDIKLWAARRESQEKLPILLRRLIRGTVDGINRLSFPSDEAVQLGGWDGSLSVTSGNEFVPSGISRWEFGNEDRPRQKADRDYAKRTQGTSLADRQETT